MPLRAFARSGQQAYPVHGEVAIPFQHYGRHQPVPHREKVAFAVRLKA
jgi:hypothetical protein